MSGAKPTVFEQCFAIVVGIEGGLSMDPHDPGNWTPGGALKGTKYGVSAHSYPNLDIAALTLEQAQTIYFNDFWTPMGCDTMPPALALLVYDSAVNNGIGAAKRLLQEALGVVADGVIGPATKAALAHQIATGLPAFCAEFQARRVVFMAAQALWAEDGLGWARRLTKLPYAAAAIVT